jgi:hypothetical protein
MIYYIITQYLMKHSPFSLSSTCLSVSSSLEQDAMSSESWSRSLREVRKACSLILAFWRYFFLSAYLSNPPLDLCLLEEYSACPCADQSGGHTTSLLFALLGATIDEVIRGASVVASILWPAMPLVLVVVIEPREPTGHKHQLLIPKTLHLLLCDRQQRRQNKHSRLGVRGGTTSRD